ncbi:MAG: hypothetical protein WCK67_06180 [bacterium]
MKNLLLKSLKVFILNPYKWILNRPVILHKLLIFLWINLSYILFIYLFMGCFAAELIRPDVEAPDRFAAMLYILTFLLLVAIPYYILSNLFFFISYRKTRGLKINLGNALLFYKPLFSWKYSLVILFHILSIFINLLLYIYWIDHYYYFSSVIGVIFSLIWTYLNLSAISTVTSKYTSRLENNISCIE